MDKLTREYFEENGYDTTITEFEGMKFWKAKLTQRYEKGDNMFADVSITNIMYPNEFSFSGEIGHKGKQVRIGHLIIKNMKDLTELYEFLKIKYENGTWICTE